MHLIEFYRDTHFLELPMYKITQNSGSKDSLYLGVLVELLEIESVKV